MGKCLGHCYFPFILQTMQNLSRYLLKTLVRHFSPVCKFPQFLGFPRERLSPELTGHGGPGESAALGLMAGPLQGNLLSSFSLNLILKSKGCNVPKPKYVAVDQLVADFTEAGVEVQNCPSFHYEAFPFVLGMGLNPKKPH